MGFREAVTVCFQDYYKFSGRARRPEYWWFILFVFIVPFPLTVIDAVIFGEGMLLGLNGLFALLVFIPQLAVSWRRMHDIGLPGWYNLLPAVPLILIYPLFLIGFSDRIAVDQADVSVIYLLSVVGVFIATIRVVVWLIRPTQSGENRFGPEPPA